MWGRPMCFKSRVFFAAAAVAAIHPVFSLYSLQNGPNSNGFPILSMKMSESQMQTIKKMWITNTRIQIKKALKLYEKRARAR